MLTSEFILGVVSSLVASLIVIIFKNQLSNLLNVVFLKVYPQIGGRFEILLPETNNTDKQRHVLILNQFGGKIWGRIETYSDYKKVSVDKVTGKVTPSRIFIFEFESPLQIITTLAPDFFIFRLTTKKCRVIYRRCVPIVKKRIPWRRPSERLMMKFNF